jgi:hypothetical protein
MLKILDKTGPSGRPDARDLSTNVLSHRGVNTNTAVFLGMTSCNLRRFTDVSEERTVLVSFTYWQYCV